MSPVKKPPQKPKPEPPGKPASDAPAKESRAKPGAKGALKEYFESTRLPVHSLVFVLPLAVFYEAAILVVNRPLVLATGTVHRVTADKFIRDLVASLLERVGVRGATEDPLYYGIMSGAVVVLALLVWQIVSRKTWQVRPTTLLGMLAESVVIGFLWLLAAKFIVEPLLRQPPQRMTIEEAPASWLYGPASRDIVIAVGAGVYEEFLFRLALVWLFAMIVMGVTGLEWDGSRIVAVLLSALAFASYHNLGSLAENFSWAAFLFRTVSGLFFGAIYYVRGFGVAVGCHAMYDIFWLILVKAHPS